MKKIISVLLVAASLMAAFIAVDGGRKAKNSIGSFLQYGTCPNCNDSWWWKESGHIWVYDLERGKDYTVERNMPEIIPARVNSGMMICNECLANPEAINTDKIEEHLLSFGWKPETVAQAIMAVHQYKTKKTGE